MNLSDIESVLNAETKQAVYADLAITGGYTSDLLSDVMGNAHGSTVLITIQAHKNTVAVCSLAGIAAIVICNGRNAPDDMLESAKDEGIAVFVTAKNQFEVSGLIYGSLQAPGSNVDTGNNQAR
jgi:hypothetical protein